MLTWLIIWWFSYYDSMKVVIVALSMRFIQELGYNTMDLVLEYLGTNK